MAVDKAWHEKPPARINLPISSNWRSANESDSAAHNTDVVRSLKYGRPVEDFRVVDYEFAPTTIAGFHLRASLFNGHLR